jgi:mannobiose 2-epimerase
MDTQARLQRLYEEIDRHLNEELIPFWTTHGVDPEHGGFLTYLDVNGEVTGESTKTLICQTRLIYTSSSAHRNGLGGGVFLERAKQGVDFLLEHFWDKEYGGWYWTTAGDGTPENESKLAYGQSFAIYALSEYAMASDDGRGLTWAEKTRDVLMNNAADALHGGFYEFMERDWKRKAPGVYGGDRKSMDIHMHLMEAFTNLYDAAGKTQYRDDACKAIDLLFKHMIHPDFGTGIAQFSLDWKPLRAILFKDVWGSDRDVEEEEGRPLNNTSFGHNVEFGWLLRHSLHVLEMNEDDYKDALRKLYDHCLAYGIDHERGGVYCEGPHDHGPARERNKEFWQQAEALVGMLDAFDVFRDEKYLDAYENVHDFVMTHMVNHTVGEWYPLLDENNVRLAEYMGHAWKNNYHTVRSMIECRNRLSRLLTTH